MKLTLTLTTLGREALEQAAREAGFQDASLESCEPADKDNIQWKGDRLHLTPCCVLALCDATALYNASLNCHVLTWCLTQPTVEHEYASTLLAEMTFGVQRAKPPA